MFFDDYFPCRIKECDRQHVRNWLKMFILFLEMNNTDMIKFTIFLLDEAKLTEPMYT
jgi:hypothetical protein